MCYGFEILLRIRAYEDIGFSAMSSALKNETKSPVGSTALHPELTTKRLRLRPWVEADLEPFAALNADPEVMAWMPAPMSLAQTRELVARIHLHFETHGFGLWAVEVPDEAPMIGFVGLMRPDFEAHFMPCVEIGWRLARAWWNRGFASEGAQAALEWGFTQGGLDEIVSFTVPGNQRSQGVMRGIGMRRTPADDFRHPRLTIGDPLREHVLYRLAKDSWKRQV
ncbi:MAG: GNAT family N-acetyltransferase [Deltaproteobacteria bacterium]